MKTYIFLCNFLSDSGVKNVAVVFVLMPSRRESDNRAVLSKIKDLTTSLAVKTFVLDFEAATWAALRSVFADVHLHGCNFHFTQAIWRKIQALGLALRPTNDRKEPTSSTGN